MSKTGKQKEIDRNEKESNARENKNLKLKPTFKETQEQPQNFQIKVKSGTNVCKEKQRCTNISESCYLPSGTC